ncbi:hypothetical protein FSP39_003307 [Pinctada imbricata]|uniref:G-protein coupled receptors family 1 profile domain-containing protein n=1 Tax=Pinctada imbricata TaxID=66713 RepID=A0AA89BK52_PINIB|nr:hypothetical protein FSP39_003307 [Pinctada imbricata]
MSSGNSSSDLSTGNWMKHNMSSIADYVSLCAPFQYLNSFTVYGLLFPIVSMVTVITNCLIISVFVERRMRSPTTVLLTGLAASDAIAAAISVPLYIYLYGLGFEDRNLSYPMCIYHEYSYIISNIFHTASAWLTTTLGVQRYVVVAYPFRGPRLCTMQKSYTLVCIVFLAAPLIYIPTFLYRDFQEVKVDVNGTFVSTCYCPLSGVEVYDKILVFLKSFLVKIIPCTTLILVTFALIRRLEIETDRMLRLQAESEGERRDFRHIRRTSIMVALIVITFLLVEIPSTVKVIITNLDSTAIDKESDYTMSMYMNFSLLVSYHINFWIYVSLSEHFRTCLRSLCSFRKKSPNHDHQTSLHSHVHTMCLTEHSKITHN